MISTAPARASEQGSAEISGRDNGSPLRDHARPSQRPDRKTERHPTQRGLTLSEPVKVAEFWKNRKGESIRATLVTYEGRNCFDLRQHFTAHDGRMQPTKKGITVAVLRLPELAAAVNKAVTVARDLGLIDEAES
jgi:hypothetical protein